MKISHTQVSWAVPKIKDLAQPTFEVIDSHSPRAKNLTLFFQTNNLVISRVNNVNIFYEINELLTNFHIPEFQILFSKMHYLEGSLSFEL